MEDVVMMVVVLARGVELVWTLCSGAGRRWRWSCWWQVWAMDIVKDPRTGRDAALGSVSGAGKNMFRMNESRAVGESLNTYTPAVKSKQ
jgi:hypothetical protein